MDKLTFVTGNHGKYVFVRDYFKKEGIDIELYSKNLEEPDINDIELISKAKAQQAYETIKKPCFVCDSGFYIEDYPNNPRYPGVFVKRSGISSNIDALLEKMKNVDNRKCKFVDCLTFYDGNNFYSFYATCEGMLAYKKSLKLNEDNMSNLWYVFIPLNNNVEHKTLSNMTQEEREQNENANELFLKWYKNEYYKEKVLKI